MLGKDKLIPYLDRPSLLKETTALLVNSYKANIVVLQTLGITQLQLTKVNAILCITPRGAVNPGSAQGQVG